MMPNYDFECKNCNETYEELATFDETGVYESVVCPKCGSKKKDKLMSACNHAFTNPEGTDRWNNSQTGHDYRFKHNIPKVKQERAMAEAMSHMGNPYAGEKNPDIEQYGEGVHDPETRGGLS
jgi:putative FmdB family regulatory protein